MGCCSQGHQPRPASGKHKERVAGSATACESFLRPWLPSTLQTQRGSETPLPPLALLGGAELEQGSCPSLGCSPLGGAHQALGQGGRGRNGRPFPDGGWEQHGRLLQSFSIPWDQLERCPGTSQREKLFSSSRTGLRLAAPVQPGFRPVPAWRRLEALIMFAGCLEYKRQCPEPP